MYKSGWGLTIKGDIFLYFSHEIFNNVKHEDLASGVDLAAPP